MGKKSPAPPPAPDYAAAATAQGQANKEAALQTSVLSNPNIISPYGNQTVTYNQDPNNPGGGSQATVTQTLTPEAQAALNAQQKTQLEFANLGLQGIGQAKNILSTPFNPNLPNLQTSVAPSKELNYGPNAADYAATSNVQGDTYGQAQGVDSEKYGLAQGINAADYGQAQGVNAADYGQALRAIDTSNVAAMPVNAGMTGQQAIMSRLQPQLQQSRDAMSQNLINQGITQGSEAYNRALTQQGQQENDMLTQAAMQGLNLDMSANQQGYNQAAQNANFYNQGLGQDFGQGATAQQMQNQAIAQNFGQGAQAQEMQNAAIGQNFGQNMSAQQLQNQAISQNFGQGMAAQDAANAARAQNYGQASSSAGMYNQAAAQQQNQNLQNAQFGNTALQQSLAQQLALRNQPINEINSLMSGSQIQNPQFQAYSGSNVQAAPIFQGLQAQGQYAQNQYGQQMAGANANTSGVMGLLGSAATAGAMAF